MSLNKIIKSRRSIRKFKNKTPDWRVIIECIDTMRYAPMSGGNFTLKFILVKDKNKIERLAKYAQQPFVGTVKYIVVVCSNPLRTIKAYGNRGKMYVRQQAGAAMQNFLLKLHERGLATCWVGHFVERLIKTELKIPNEIHVEALFPIGYKAQNPKEKPKVDIDNCLYFDEYENKQMKTHKKINA